MTIFLLFFFLIFVFVFDFLNFFIYLFLAVLGLRFCERAFSSCGERGPLFIAVRGPLTIAASLVAEHRFQTRRLSSCGSRAQPLRGMWDLPIPGLEPVSPALAGRFSTTVPPGKPFTYFLFPYHTLSLLGLFTFNYLHFSSNKNFNISPCSLVSSHSHCVDIVKNFSSRLLWIYLKF